jgi:hypothetical protein
LDSFASFVSFAVKLSFCVLRVLRGEALAFGMAPRSIDSYIAPFPPKARAVLKKVRAVIRNAAPRAEEKISYGIPAVRDERRAGLLRGFKNYIGLYPPVRGYRGR